MKRLIPVLLAAALALPALPLPAAEDVSAKQVAQLQVQMKKMQEQMNRIQKTRDAKERGKLMQEQLQTMRDSLKLLSSPTGGSLGGLSEAQVAGELKKRQDLLERRMHLLLLMMDHMIQREQIAQSAQK
jgi:hypothetical protein